MKLIIAYIQPERLNAVKQALYEREVYKMSVSNALGCGQQKGYLHQYRGAIWSSVCPRQPPSMPTKAVPLSRPTPIRATASISATTDGLCHD